MSKYSITIFLSFFVFFGYSQNKKELNATILRLQSDSTLMSNTIAEKQIIISKNITEIEKLNRINNTKSSEIDSLNKINNEIHISFSSMKKKADSLIEVVKIADSLNNIVKIGFTSFLLNKKISTYGCSKYDGEGEINFYYTNSSEDDFVTIGGDHWGGPIYNVTYDKIMKEIEMQFMYYNEAGEEGEGSFKIRFGDRGEIFEIGDDGIARSRKLCDYETGAQSNYIFNEIDLCSF